MYTIVSHPIEHQHMWTLLRASHLQHPYLHTLRPQTIQKPKGFLVQVYNPLVQQYIPLDLLVD